MQISLEVYLDSRPKNLTKVCSGAQFPSAIDPNADLDDTLGTDEVTAEHEKISTREEIPKSDKTGRGPEKTARRENTELVMIR